MDIEKNVQEFFAECGIKAKKIPERKEDGFKSPDFEINDEVSILVEVKEKLDDKDLINYKNEHLESDGIYEGVEALGWQRRYKTIFHHASEQLTTQKERVNSNFCFIFMVMSGISPRSQKGQAFSTLYGATNLLPTKKGKPVKKVLYYTHSEFYNLRHVLDGVFLVCNGRVELLINDKSPRYQELITSKFVNRFSSILFDPISQTDNEQVYYCDAIIPRCDEKNIKEYILNKYGFGDREACFMDIPNFITHASTPKIT